MHYVFSHFDFNDIITTIKFLCQKEELSARKSVSKSWPQLVIAAILVSSPDTTIKKSVPKRCLCFFVTLQIYQHFLHCGIAFIDVTSERFHRP